MGAVDTVVVTPSAKNCCTVVGPLAATRSDAGRFCGSSGSLTLLYLSSCSSSRCFWRLCSTTACESAVCSKVHIHRNAAHLCTVLDALALGLLLSKPAELHALSSLPRHADRQTVSTHLAPAALRSSLRLRKPPTYCLQQQDNVCIKL